MRYARISDERQRGMFIGVEFSDVDVDEPHVRVLECGTRASATSGSAACL